MNYSMDNFSRPYLPEISSFDDIILGEKTLSEPQLENYIYSEENFCKLALDELKETLAFIAYSFLSSKEVEKEKTLLSLIDEDFLEKENKVGFIHTIGFRSYAKGLDIETELFANCVADLKEKGADAVFIITPKDFSFQSTLERESFVLIYETKKELFFVKK